MATLDEALNYIPESDGRQMVKDHIARLEKALGVANKMFQAIYEHQTSIAKGIGTMSTTAAMANHALKEISDIMGGG